MAERPQHQYYIGLMSGTSLDGVDAVLVDFCNNKTTLISNYSHPIPADLQTKLKAFTQPDWQGSIASIGIFHQQLGKLFADAVTQLLKASNIKPQEIIAVGSHGQTIWHQPDGEHPFSLQLGDANLIAEQTNIITVADFRSRDIAAGGQGAPLVPAFHSAELTHATINRVILNIGGIGNISYLPAKNSSKSIVGFDTGPGNGLIDAWIHAHKGEKFDLSGSWGKSGVIEIGILEKLLKEPYFTLDIPKSTGKELFNLKWLKKIVGSALEQTNPENIQATLTELTALSITNDITKYCEDCDELFICGGGVHNDFLIKRIKQHLPKVAVGSTKSLGINPDWMEAIAFAWLARQTIEGKEGNLPSATGAKGKRVLGAIYPA